ncbi:MAG: hypothetical protein HYX78_02240 [Armatimonadetes bacterium]|nr:hypothetical protein [Armatimonadota bacterium]
MIGPLVTCLERGGDFEVIRLLWSAREKRPDVLIVDKRSGHVIVQECKATCCSVDHQDLSVDVCGAIRKHKRDGARQLVWPGTDALSGHGVKVAPVSDDLTRLLGCSEKSVVVTAIPDGEINRFRRSIKPPERAVCPQSCADNCLYSQELNIITALFAEELEGSADSDALLEFLGTYKAAERAAWGGAHGCFSNLYLDMLSSFSNLSRQGESNTEGASLASFLVGPLDYAVQNRLYVDFQQVGGACSEYLGGTLRESVFSSVHDLAIVQGEIERPPVKESSARQFHAMIMGGEERQSERPPVGNWRFKSRGRELDEAGVGTSIEARVVKSNDGQLDITFVPAESFDERIASNIQWALAETIGGEYASDVFNAFDDEVVRYRSGENEHPRQFRLGRTLYLPWWPWPASRQQLRQMRGCCPRCDHLADWMEHLWHEPFLEWHRFWRHHRHRKHAPWWNYWGPTAYVTSDGRGMLRIPNWGREH